MDLRALGPIFRALPRKWNFTSGEWRHFEARRLAANLARTQQISLREKDCEESSYFYKYFLWFDNIEMQTER